MQSLIHQYFDAISGFKDFRTGYRLLYLLCHHFISLLSLLLLLILLLINEGMWVYMTVTEITVEPLRNS